MCFLDESGRDEAKCSKKVVIGRSLAGAIKSLVNARDMQLECARVLHQTLLVSLLTYGSETKLWKEEEKTRIRALQMNNLRGLLGIRRMDKVLNAQVR